MPKRAGAYGKVLQYVGVINMVGVVMRIRGTRVLVTQLVEEIISDRRISDLVDDMGWPADAMVESLRSLVADSERVRELEGEGEAGERLS